MDRDETLEAGHPAHPDHESWLLELGRVTRGAAQLATICFDLARMIGGVPEELMYDDPLGVLQRRLEAIGLGEPSKSGNFLAVLDSARRARNDVMHAFLVRDGLFRRTSAHGYESDFYTVGSLVDVRRRLEEASQLGNELLRANGGAAIAAWRQPPN